MQLSERPIQPGTLSGVSELPRGKQGRVFLLENTIGDQLVVKFSNDKPIEAIAGTRILQRANAPTADIRAASADDLAALAQAVNAAPPAPTVVPLAVKDFGRLAAAKGPIRFKCIALMEYARGDGIKDVREEQLGEFLAVVADPGFQEALGRIVAADAFAGNPDRLAAAIENGTLTGWYNDGNLVIAPGTRRPVAIDNGFQPGMNGYKGLQAAATPWGGTAYNGRWGSIASACDKYVRTEAEKLFDRLLASASESHPASAETVKAAAAHKAAFVAKFAEGAKAATLALLMRGQNWVGQLNACGADAAIVAEFRARKRVLRQVRAGEDPQDALARAADEGRYRKWVLTKERNLSEDEADRLLRGGLGKYRYKLFMKLNPPAK